MARQYAPRFAELPSLMYFLRELTEHGRPPQSLTDSNLRTDLHWVRRLTGSNPVNTGNLLEILNTENRIRFSNDLLTSKFNKKFKTTIAAFGLQAEDTEQVQGYAEGLRLEFPGTHIECYVIYCIGNQGFRVFPVS